MLSLIHLQDSDSLQLYPGSEHPYHPWWNTSLRWRGYLTSSCIWPSPVLMWTPFPPPNQYNWYPGSPWRLRTMRWSRYCIFASKFMNRFSHQWISCSYITKSVSWLWGYQAWNETSSCIPDLYWCLRILWVCKSGIFLQGQRTLWIHYLGCCRCMRSWSTSTRVFHQWLVSYWSTGLAPWTWDAVGK